MANQVGMGVVGAGAIGIRGALSHLCMDDVRDVVRVTAICDPVDRRAAAAAERFGVPKAYLSYEELLDDPNVDAVTICTPIGLHYEQGLKAIEKGKHIHFNKTMTTTVAEADELIRRAEKASVKIIASPGMMLHPHNQRIRKAVLAGELGHLCWAATGTSGVGDYHMNEEFRTGEDILTDVDPSWYYRKPGGGPQYDVTVYCLHNLTGILGPAKKVTAFSGLVVQEREYLGKSIACDMDDTTMMVLDFGNSLFAVVYAAAKGSLTEGFQPSIFGTAGSVIGTQLNGSDLKIDGVRSPHVSEAHAACPESHVFEDLMQLVDWVGGAPRNGARRNGARRNGEDQIASAEHARHVIDIIESGYRSAETGQACDLMTRFEPIPVDRL
jgi:predicted dehydrogenase